MPSSRNRKAKRLQLGVNRKLTVTRWTNGMTGRVVLSRINPRGFASECDNNGKMLPLGGIELAGGNVRPASTTRSLEGEKASEGAERSCRPRRRLRGLRKGKRRSRGGKPRRTPSLPAPEAKRGHERRVNHSGRKFIWAARAGNRLANLKAARRFIDALPRIPQEVQNLLSRESFHREVIRASSSVKAYAGFKKSWRGVKRRADAMGIPAVAAVHTSPWRFLSVRSSVGDWELLLAALRPPQREEAPAYAASGLGHYWLTTRQGFLCSRCGRLLTYDLGPCPGRGGGRGNETPRSSRGRRGSGRRSRDFRSLF